MIQRYYFIEVIIVLFIVALIATAIKYPKDVFVELRKGLFYRVFVHRVSGIIGIILIILLLPFFLYGKLMSWNKSTKRKSR
jgi:heme A synthase